MYDNSWLDKIVKCPKCHQDVREGDRIWKDGESLCPKCYQDKMLKLYEMYRIGYSDCLNALGLNPDDWDKQFRI